MIARKEIFLLEESEPASLHSLTSLGLAVREAEVLYWISEGKTNSEILNLCSISNRTVHKHFEHIYEKLGVETLTAATLREAESEPVGVRRSEDGFIDPAFGFKKNTSSSFKKGDNTPAADFQFSGDLRIVEPISFQRTNRVGF